MDIIEATKREAAREATGAKFSLASMQYARSQSWDAVKRIAAGIRPGMTEKQACAHAADVLAQGGMDRIWHPAIVRFGAGTLKTFKEQSDPARALGQNDIFFIDIGPVWDGHEGDAGDTFVVGDDPEMQACAEAARILWREVDQHWRSTGASGAALYAFAAARAAALGWRLNLDIKGHRVCDFPHAIYRAGSLGDFGLCPNTGLWVLEIQIAHPSRAFGAFYEDILFADDTKAAE
jgi:Xaa-Pro aminopeptidase